jgi:hypothetical protein
MRDGAAEGRAANSTGAKMEFFLFVAFLINDVERRFHYQYDSFQQCNQAREAMVKDERTSPVGPLGATAPRSSSNPRYARPPPT